MACVVIVSFFKHFADKRVRNNREHLAGPVLYTAIILIAY